VHIKPYVENRYIPRARREAYCQKNLNYVSIDDLRTLPANCTFSSSYTRGEGLEQSDIDLIVVSNHSKARTSLRESVG